MDVNVAAVNRLTASWASHVADRSGVLSGAGLWPLLALLEWSADEPGRQELAEAVGVPADDAVDAAATVLDGLAKADGVDAALGLWIRPEAQVRPEWRDAVPADTLGELTGDAAADQRALDTWASEHTGGLVDRFPVEVDRELMLTLATALALRTTWQHRFSDEPVRPGSGPWRGRRLAGLVRQTRDLDEVRVAETPAGMVTLNAIAGDNGLDVHLVLGEEGRAPAEVLPAAVDALSGSHPLRLGPELLQSGDVGSLPGLGLVDAQRPGVATTTVRFTVRSEHDLISLADVFGLATVTRPDRGHFSSIGAVPLRVDQAKQAAVAIFSAYGFEAAAVTAIGLRAVSMPVHRAKALAVRYDRPFGFVAVHRESGMVLFAGWVDDPEPWSG
jgi:serine protease inhibitor